VEQEQLTLHVHLISLPVFSVVSVVESVVFCMIFCRLFFVFLSLFVCPSVFVFSLHFGIFKLFLNIAFICIYDSFTRYIVYLFQEEQIIHPRQRQ